MVKPGPIIGLLIGIGLVFFPMIGFFIGEASLSDSKGKMMGFGFIIFGAFMVVVNIIALAKGTDDVLSSFSDTTAASTQSNINSKIESEHAKKEPEEKMIRCRFCKKRYSVDYNGCPHCKKK